MGQILRDAAGADGHEPLAAAPANPRLGQRQGGPTARPRGAPICAAGATNWPSVTELHWDLGGLAYEMAIRDHFRLDVLLRRAALLQECDARCQGRALLRMDEDAVAGNRPRAPLPTAGKPSTAAVRRHADGARAQHGNRRARRLDRRHARAALARRHGRRIGIALGRVGPSEHECRASRALRRLQLATRPSAALLHRLWCARRPTQPPARRAAAAHRSPAQSWQRCHHGHGGCG